MPAREFGEELRFQGTSNLIDLKQLQEAVVPTSRGPSSLALTVLQQLGEEALKLTEVHRLDEMTG